MLLSGCSSTKFIPDRQYLLEKVELKSEQKGFDAAVLEPYIRQRANSKWFSLFKVPLATYALAGRDTTKWINRTLRRMGESPVIYDTIQANITLNDLKSAMQSMGYMHAKVALQTKIKGKKLTAIYMLSPGEPYYMNSVRYDIQDDTIADILRKEYLPQNRLLKGSRFTVDRLEAERENITNLLANKGFYKFNKDFIRYSADSSENSRGIDLTAHVLKYRVANDSSLTLHPRYRIRKVNFVPFDSTGIRLRKRVLGYANNIKVGSYYSLRDLQRTYNNFTRLGAVRYTNITFDELTDSAWLDANIKIGMNKPSSISIRPEGTNTAGDLGAALTVAYTNRNLFRGSEAFSIELRGAFEAITGLEGYNDQNYQEYNVEAKLVMPRFIAPFLSKRFRKRSQAISELSLSWNLQNRPEFHRRVFSAAWRYRWADSKRNLSYKLDLFDLNYVYMPWISQTFKTNYIDSVSNRNAILRYNYEDLFIMKIGLGVSYNDGKNVIRGNIETSGNLLNSIASIARFRKDDAGRYTLFNIAYAQYVKFDIDYTRLLQLDPHNSIAMHAGLGIAYPYGNSRVLPFEKRYFSGGANSVRGWGVRELGPGKFKRSDGRIDFINQTGDMRLDLNLEYRTFLFWKLDGAVFVDAGNIWTLRDYKEQPGGQFKLNEFYKQIAVAYGVGLRLNFGYFILRFDAGMKAINPAYETRQEHYAFLNPKFSRDFSFHFAVGLPF